MGVGQKQDASPVLKNLVRKPAGCLGKNVDAVEKWGVVSRAKWVGQCQKLERTV